MAAMRPQDQMQATYRALRWGVVILGLALPWILWLGGRLLAGEHLQASMSDYYHTVMRDEFVGVLFAVGALLVLYRGYTRLENVALNLGGLFLAGVALFPNAGPGRAGGLTLHGTLAVLFFASIAYVCVFRAADTLGLMHDEVRERRFRTAYRALGGAMLLSPLAAALLAAVLQPGPGARSLIFFVEAAGVYVFVAYWIVKSVEIGLTGSEALALAGRLVTPVHGARDLFRRIPVQRVDGPGPRGER